MTKIITLTTDFGEKDYFVGAVKGVILSINPKARIVDIAHQISHFNLISAALNLRNFYSYFPSGTIHLAIVDPGVGSKRKPILIQTEKYFFVGPDNGIFSWIGEPTKKKIHLTNSKFFLNPVSPTFQARDIFAPVAAYLSLGVRVEEFGKAVEKIVKLRVPPVQFKNNARLGEIIHIDNFGNLITNIQPKDLKKGFKNLKIRSRQISKKNTSFGDVSAGEILAYWGSAGFLEIGVTQRSAVEMLKAKLGEKIEIEL